MEKEERDVHLQTSQSMKKEKYTCDAEIWGGRGMDRSKEKG